MFYVYYYIHRYQPGSLNYRADKKTVELQTLTERENMSELEKKPLNESFSPRHLLLPSSESPTKTSGLIVYVTTAITCKRSFTDKLCLSAANTSLCILTTCALLEKFLIFLLLGI